MNLFLKHLPIVFLLAVGFAYADEKQPLDYGKIDKIYIYKNNDKIEKIYLNQNETSEFIANWNNAGERGLCKYRVDIWVVVESRDGKNRKFRINADNMKENNDYCYMLSRQLSEKLYEKIK